MSEEHTKAAVDRLARQLIGSRGVLTAEERERRNKARDDYLCARKEEELRSKQKTAEAARFMRAKLKAEREASLDEVASEAGVSRLGVQLEVIAGEVPVEPPTEVGRSFNGLHYNDGADASVFDHPTREKADSCPVYRRHDSVPIAGTLGSVPRRKKGE